MGHFREVNETIDGVTKTRGEWCEEYGADPKRVYMRMYQGKSFQEALSAPYGQRKSWWRDERVTIDGETRSPAEWSKLKGLTRPCVYRRMYAYGMTLEEALSAPGRINTADSVKVRIRGVERSIREWCAINRTSVKKAVERYRKTGDAHYAVMSAGERREWRREHAGDDFKAPDGEGPWAESRLSINPTQEVVDMCTSCTRPDCNSTIAKCLKLKRERERAIKERPHEEERV